MIILPVSILAVYNQIALKVEEDKIIANGQMIDVGDYNIHVYSEGDSNGKPVLIFLSGSATVAPVYDFKPLYSKLSTKYQIAVVEKAGYGYSDYVEVSRDIDSMVSEIRNALIGAYINGPYILLPHSMSGLEAIYWAQKNPDEIAGIIGLDMAVPSSYDDFDFSRVKKMQSWGVLSSKLGFLRIPGIYHLNTNGLNEKEIAQQKMLMHKNAVNDLYILEGKQVENNAKIVKGGPKIVCPMLLFSSNGKEIGDFWISTQKEFAKDHNAEHYLYDCGHYLHYYKSDDMAEKIVQFISANF